MGSKYPILPSKEIVKVLKRFGFEKVSQKGSHVKYKKSNDHSKIVIIPLHGEIAKGTLKSILDQADILLEDFLEEL